MRPQRVFAAAALLLGLFLSRKSRAEPHARDGFYLQLGTGVGATEFASTAPAVDGTDHRSGPVLDASLLLGVPLRPGLVLGVGGLMSVTWLSSPDRMQNGMPVTTEDSGGPYIQVLRMVGPFVDYYPSAALGWHAQALVGYASLADADFYDGAPGGIGLMAGVGQDWRTSEHWSIGFMARLKYAHMTFGSDGTTSERDTVISPSLEVSFTYH